jgi:hypothetical protein
MTDEQRKQTRKRWNKWYHAHKEQHKECQRRSRVKRRDKINAYLREYRAKKKAERKNVMPQKEPCKQQTLPTLAPVEVIGRPEDGPRCACGRVLYPYEHDRCLHCARLNIIARREGEDFVKRLTAPRRSHRKQAAMHQTAAGASD